MYKFQTARLCARKRTARERLTIIINEVVDYIADAALRFFRPCLLYLLTVPLSKIRVVVMWQVNPP